MLDVLVLGAGRSGGYAAELLASSGLRVGVADRDSVRVKQLSRRLGVEGLLGSGEDEAVMGAARRAGVVAVALPGRVAYPVVRRLLEGGCRIVDVSFYPEDPWSLEPLASRTVYVPDAGLAPGLSSMLAARLDRVLGGAEYIDIYVGGVSRNPSAPLGLASAWSAEDLVDEYLRPARMRLEGRLVEVDPLEYTGRVEVPGSGVFEYFASDGLRTLLRSLAHVPRLRELTLRYPGHVEAMRLLKSLGLLEEVVEVEGCRCPANLFLAAVLEKRLSGTGDRVVLYVEGGRGGRKAYYRLDMEGTVERSAMSITTGSFLTATAILVLRGMVSGFTPPEELGMHDALFSETLRLLEKAGIVLEAHA